MIVAGAAAGPGFAALSRMNETGRWRELRDHSGLVDFSSNDYLGLAKDPAFVAELMVRYQSGLYRFGSTGSRLLTGQSSEAEGLEILIADRHEADAALLFNSGYDANIGLLGALKQLGPDYQIIYDEHVHASIKNGIQLSRLPAFAFRHNDARHLESRLARSSKHSIVCVESLYSMDGTIAPLVDIADTCRRHNARLLVDEAHSGGVYGNAGAGLVAELGLSHAVFARTITYGKAFGCHGAAVVGSRELRQLLIHFAHSFVYSTALPLTSLIAIKLAYEFLEDDQRRENLRRAIRKFREVVAGSGSPAFLDSETQIQGMLVPLEKHRDLSAGLHAEGLDLRSIRSPTVQRGTERFRICLHSFDKDDDIERLVRLLAERGGA